MSRHDPTLYKEFKAALADCNKMDEKTLMNACNPYILRVEMDDSYSTKAKLKIYAEFTYLANAPARKRKGHVRKLTHLLK